MDDVQEDGEWLDFRWEEESGCEEDVTNQVEELAEYLIRDGENIVLQEIVLRNKR